jgi:hypothetical protein
MTNRGQKRKRDTSLVLRENAVGAVSRERYGRAIARFQLFCFSVFTSIALLFIDGETTDYCLSEYIQFLYENEFSMNWAGVVISAVQDRYPSLRKHLNGAWRSFAAWRRIEPSQRAKPISIVVLQLLLHTLFLHATLLNVVNVYVIAAHILLVYCGLLRPAEVRSLRWRDISLEIKPDGSTLISIAVQGKTSARKHIVEYISIDDAFLYAILMQLAPLFAPDEFLWPFSQDFFGKFFYSLQIAANLRGYTPYSLKRGGATTHFARHRNYDLLCQLGRWSSLTAARLYVDDSMSSLVRLRTPAIDPAVRRGLRRMFRRMGGVGESALL